MITAIEFQRNLTFHLLKQVIYLLSISPKKIYLIAKKIAN